MSNVVYNYYGTDPDEFNKLIDSVQLLTETVNNMADAFTNLVSKVTRIEDVADAAIVAIAGLKQQLDAALQAESTEEEFINEIQSIADRLDAQATELAQAIAQPGGETVEEVESSEQPAPTGEESTTAPENVGDNAQDGSTTTQPE